MLAKSATQLRVFSTAQQLKQAVQASYAIAKSHNLDDVCNFLIHREGMSPAKVQAMKEEYVRFIALAFNHHSSNKRIGISSEVDPFWHTHILFTQNYTDFCQKIGGFYFHHEPTITDLDVQRITPDFKKNTLALYRQHFGTPSATFWGSNSPLCQYNITALCQYNVKNDPHFAIAATA